jgi:hypothetical protein
MFFARLLDWLCMPIHRYVRASLLVLIVASCAPEAPGNAAADTVASGLVEAPPVNPAWKSMPSEGIEIRGEQPAVISTGPHTVLWPAEAAPLEPPYTVRALLTKQSGRIHEGYGLVFGGERLDRPEAEQAYSYFLIRGDGSFLIRRREGTALPILRGWTTDRAIRRDTDGAGQPNALEVAVGRDSVVFRVNGSEVARLPTSELRVTGMAGIRVAHDVTLEIDGFFAGPPSRSGE